jgi:hypothetical protein
MLAALCGCIQAPPPEPPPAPPQPAAIQTRKTLNQTTQNVLELSEALAQGGVRAETKITGEGLEVYSDAYRTSVGKLGVMSVEQKMQLYQAEHGSLPKTHAEFMSVIIGKGQPDGVQLPMLPYYQEWSYDPEAKKLVVIEFPAK